MIRQPSSVIVAGPSGSGKTDLVEQWLRHRNVFQVQPKKIVYAYDRWQPWFERMQKKEGIQIHRGVPDPRHLNPMVWSHARRCVGVGRSHGRRGAR